LAKNGQILFIRLYWTNLQVYTRVRVFVQLSKSSQAHPIKKNNVLILENFLYDEEQKQFSKQKCGSALNKRTKK